MIRTFFPTGSGGMKGIPLTSCTNIKLLPGDGKNKLKWTDPEDAIYGGETIAAWIGTKLVRKVGSYPTSETDGTLVADCKTRNAHQDIWLTDSGLTNGETYYYTLFPYTQKVCAYSDANRISGQPECIPLGPATGASATRAKQRVSIKWTDPDDVAATTEKDGAIWAGTKVVRKAGSAPTSVTDGTVVVTSTVKNQYSQTAYEDSGLTNGTEYFYAIYPYSDAETYSAPVVISATPNPYAPNSCTSMSIAEGDSKLIIKWDDPDDKTVNADTVVWAGTKVVRKAGSAPTSVTDGTVVLTSTTRDAYKTTGYEDSGLTNGTEYFYAAFSYSTDGVYGTGISVSGTPAMQYSATLANNTWAQIQKAAKEGKASSSWNVGDEIDIALTGDYKQTLTLQIAGFNHDATNSVTFILKNLMRREERISSASMSNVGWDSTEMFTKTLPAILACLPSDLQSVIKPVTKVVRRKEISGNELFLLSEEEVGLSVHSAGNEGTQYPIFTNNASRVKKLSNGTGSANYWWLRSPAGTGTYCCISSGGSASSASASNARGVCFGFCVG